MKQITADLTFPHFLGKPTVTFGKVSEYDCAIDTPKTHQLGYTAALIKEYSNKDVRLVAREDPCWKWFELIQNLMTRQEDMMVKENAEI